MKKEYSLISFLLRGKRRLKVLYALKEEKTPKEIANECGISLSNVSNSLSELSKESLIACLTPESHFCRIYKITNKGKNVLKHLEDYKKKKKA